MNAIDSPSALLQRAAAGRLVLELRDGQRLLVNGALLQARGRCSVVLCNRARFLFGRQVMEPEEATSPARRLYLALQGAYAGEEQEREALAAEARRLALAQLPARSAEGRALVEAALDEMAAGRGRAALLLVRRLFAEDDAALAA